MSTASPTPNPTFVAPAKDAKGNLERDALRELDSISLREILDQDSRPTFVLDLDSDYLDYGEHKDQLTPVFCNAALRLHDRLLDSITGADADPGSTHEARPEADTTTSGFRLWATSVTRFDDSRDVFPLTFLYRSMLWTGSTVRQRWRMISGNQCYEVSSLPKGDLQKQSSGMAPEELSSKQAPTVDVGIVDTTLKPRPNSISQIRPNLPNRHTYQNTPPPSTRSRTPRVTLPERSTSDEKSYITTESSSSITLASPEQDVPDWTVAQPTGVLSEHVRFARSVDWGATPLGPMSSWSREFRQIATLVMKNPHPAALFWGEELTMLYNEPYKNEVAGNKHPDLMGTGFSGPFAELWDGVAPIFRECARTGNSIRKENDYLPIHRYGYLEETFFSWSFVPLYGGTDRIQGFYNAPFETTYQTIRSRRMQTLRHLGDRLIEARSIKHFWKCVLHGLEDNHWDVPFALLYSINDSEDADTASHSSDSTISLKSCLLEGSIGIPEGHPASIPKLDLKRSKEGFVPAFREAMRTREPTTLQTRDGTLPEALLEGIDWRGFQEPCKEAIIFPVRPTNGENIFAFLLIGVNPRRAYDDDYKTFAAMLNRQLATSLASTLLFEDELRRSRNAAEVAALQRERLSQELELQTSRMRRMTELSPLGMYLFSPDGVLLEANDRYYEMTGYPRDTNGELSFLEHISEDSQPIAQTMWDNMMSDLQSRSVELQFKPRGVQPRDLTGEPIEYWVLASSMPEVGMDGKLRSIMGSITDISHMKWAQGLQDRRLREAEETKRQQNEFIDITSHEMRNPLSAILICADDIRDTLSRHTFAESDAPIVEDCIEAANNIALCVQHQKSIVDDILTVSKLDSNLLVISPVPVQPVAVVQRAMGMFKPEVQAKDIQFDFCPHSSLEHLGIDWVKLDPSRLLQITVNLITNAIKFTQTSPTRKISVHLRVSVDQPDLQSKGFEYVPTRGPLLNVTASEDWGQGDLLYIRVEVQDTGCGLTPEEKQRLFERFAQASPRTHAYYGGSGLGLFISRQLAELHGGQIGVSSEAQVGSTFGFFIQARRVDTAEIESQSLLEPLKMPQEGQRNPPIAVPIPSPTRFITERPKRPTTPKLSTSPVIVAPSPSSPLLHVLIVEDNIVNQKVLSKQLRKVGCIVSTADNGIHALAHLKTTEFQRPDGVPLSVILMDLEMPEMDGLTCIACIRKMQANGEIARHVPVIAVTANVRVEQIAMARESGMDDVVSKPFRVPELINKIKVLLERLANG